MSAAVSSSDAVAPAVAAAGASLPSLAQLQARIDALVVEIEDVKREIKEVAAEYRACPKEDVRRLAHMEREKEQLRDDLKQLRNELRRKELALEHGTCNAMCCVRACTHALAGDADRYACVSTGTSAAPGIGAGKATSTPAAAAF